ncbi:uncharacterized protein LOC109795396 isoform X2 [Cajanus cajan]|uniref:uncharacterized protein LOC109795396 isoform X2 n=1 Tax=Cajanus cajan TaxID=3821 RepID=UPI0010FB7AA4|nr:uncharacterized protein LOC109795396 isoform X2 [Cajanus cajan]
MMTPFKRLHLVRTLCRSSQIGESSSYLLGSCKSYSSALSNGSEGNFRSFYPHLLRGHDGIPFAGVKSLTLRSTMAAELSIFMNNKRMATTQVKAPPQARNVVTQMAMTSPGFIYEPYAPREKILFWKRWFTRSGWIRTKNDIILEINTLIANGDKKTLRKAVTEKMFSALKNEIRQRETAWRKVYWEMVEPVVKIRTLRARLIGVDRKDMDKTFIQLTLEILAKQKFEAYDSKGSVVAGDKSKEVLVRDIWVFEKSMFHPDAYWRLCGRISPEVFSH